MQWARQKNFTKSAFWSFRELVVHSELGTAIKTPKIMATVYDQDLQLKIVNAWDHKLPDGGPPPSSTSKEVLFQVAT